MNVLLYVKILLHHCFYNVRINIKRYAHEKILSGIGILRPKTEKIIKKKMSSYSKWARCFFMYKIKQKQKKL